MRSSHLLKKEVRNLRVGLTGSPGTGKKSIGRELSKITGLDFVSLNQIALTHKIGRKSQDGFVVNLKKLRKLRIATQGRIISGHLLPYVIPPHELDFVVILRCSPRTLRARYLRRGYSRKKIEENIAAELLDIISYKALMTYGRKKVAEFDTTRTKKPQTTARRIAATLNGKIRAHYGLVSWSRSASKSSENLRAFLQPSES